MAEEDLLDRRPPLCLTLARTGGALTLLEPPSSASRVGLAIALARCRRPRNAAEETAREMLDPEELDMALTHWFRVVQHRTFHAELGDLRAVWRGAVSC